METDSKYKVELLSSVISEELEQMKSKFNFWQVPGLMSETRGEIKKSLTLEEALATIDLKDKELAESDLGVLSGIGWEFVCGEEPPEVIRELREAVRAKAKSGLEMSEYELLWYRLICADREMF